MAQKYYYNWQIFYFKLKTKRKKINGASGVHETQKLITHYGHWNIHLHCTLHTRRLSIWERSSCQAMDGEQSKVVMCDGQMQTYEFLLNFFRKNCALCLFIRQFDQQKKRRNAHTCEHIVDSNSGRWKYTVNNVSGAECKHTMLAQQWAIVVKCNTVHHHTVHVDRFLLHHFCCVHDAVCVRLGCLTHAH